MISNILSTLTVSHSSSGGLNLFSKIKRIKKFNIKSKDQFIQIQPSQKEASKIPV